MLPPLSTPIEFLGQLAGALKLPLLKESTALLQAIAAIHDQRRADVELARARFNESFRQDRPNDINFNVDDCWRFQTYCERVAEQLSYETKRRFREYSERRRWYDGWTDLGNVTGYGWREQEQAFFLVKVGDYLGKKAVNQIVEWSKQPTWEPKLDHEKWAEEATKKSLNKALDRYFPKPKLPSWTPPAPDPTAQAVDEFLRKMRENEPQQQIRRSEPDSLQELLRHLPVSPVPSVPTTPRGAPK
jgi:hypothetical protein